MEDVEASIEGPTRLVVRLSAQSDGGSCGLYRRLHSICHTIAFGTVLNRCDPAGHLPHARPVGGDPPTHTPHTHTSISPTTLTTLTSISHCPTNHCGLRYTKKLTGSDFISNIKKVHLRNFELLNCFLDLLWNFEDLKNVFIHFVYNQTEPEIQP